MKISELKSVREIYISSSQNTFTLNCKRDEIISEKEKVTTLDQVTVREILSGSHLGISSSYL